MINYFISGYELVFILLITLLLFGAKQIPSLLRSLGQVMAQVRKVTQEINEEILSDEETIESCAKDIPQHRDQNDHSSPEK